MAAYKIDRNTIFQRNPDQIYSVIDDEIVMLSITKGEYYNLNKVGTDIWNLLHKPLSFTNLVETLSSYYEVDKTTCKEETRLFIEELLNKGIIYIVDETT
jgi:hypothetical protein